MLILIVGMEGKG